MVRETLPQPLQHRVASARELVRRPGRAGEPPLATAEPLVDRLLAGGLTRGELVEVVGRRSSGRFSLVMTALAAATGVGEAAALVDLGDALDPQAAAAAGVDLERLLWLRPRRMKEALMAAEAALASGFPLVVVDVGMPPVRGGRGAEAAWLRLARKAKEHEAALLVSAPYRLSGPAAGAVLAAGRKRAAWHGAGVSPRLLTALTAHIEVEKLRGRAPGGAGELTLRSAAAPPSARATGRSDPPTGQRPKHGQGSRLRKAPGREAPDREAPDREALARQTLIQRPEVRRRRGAPLPSAAAASSRRGLGGLQMSAAALGHA